MRAEYSFGRFGLNLWCGKCGRMFPDPRDGKVTHPAVSAILRRPLDCPYAGRTYKAPKFFVDIEEVSG